MKRFLRWLTHSIWPPVVVVVIALLYLNLHGFPEPVRRFIQQQFLQRGYVVNFQSLRLDWFHGIVAEKLSLADAQRPGEPLVEMTEVALQIHWSRLLSRRDVLKGLRIVNARVSVPMPPDEQGSERFTASEAYAALRFEDGGVIQIEQLTGMYCGVFVYVTGRVKHRAFAPEPSGPRTNNLSFLSRALRELHSVRSREPLDLYLDFDLDLSQPMALQGRARLHGKGVRYRRLFLERLELDVGMGEGALRILSAGAKLAGGGLSVQGHYDLAKGRTDLQVRSTFDPTVLRPFLPPALAAELASLRLYQNPVIDLRYTLSAETGTEPILSGSVQAGELQFRGVEFRSVRFQFKKQGPLITIPEAHVVMRKGELSGHGQYHLESSDFAYEFDSTLDPLPLLPLMTPAMQRWVSPCAFDEPPHIKATVRGDFVDPEAFAYDATVKAGRCRYRDVTLENASASVRLYRNRLDVRDLVLGRSDGSVTGKLTADFDLQQLVFDLRSTANPVPLAGLLGEKAVKTIEPYRFGTNVQIHAKGFVDFAHPERVFWWADVRNDQFGWWKLTAARGHGELAFSNNLCRVQLDAEGVEYGTNCAKQVRADVLIAPQLVHTTNVVVKLSDGWVRGAAWGEIPQQRVHFDFDSTADLHTLAALLGAAAAKQVEPFRFGSNTTLQARGVADLQQPGQTCWRATVRGDNFLCGPFSSERLEAEVSLTNEVLRAQVHAQASRCWKFSAERFDGNMVYSNDVVQARVSAEDFRWWKLRAKQARAEATFSNQTLQIRQFHAAVCDGVLAGQADVQCSAANPAFQLTLDARDCDIRQALRDIGNPNVNASGRLNGHLELNAPSPHPDSFQGRGNLEIANGVLLEVPVFGIFSQILNLIVPGLGSTSVTSAKCTYTIGGGQVRTDDLEFETAAAVVRSRGSIGLSKGDLDFRVEAQPFRSWPGVNIVTWMLGKIFEYKVGGTVDNPNWRPTRLPKEIMPHSEGKPAPSKQETP